MEGLVAFKEGHEEWVRSSLGIDIAHQTQLERYAAIIDEWAQRAALDRWEEWSDGICEGDWPRIASEDNERLRDLRLWMLRIIWPKTLPRLEKVLENFRRVLEDFHSVFLRHADASRIEGAVVTEKFYQNVGFASRQLRDELLAEYNRHVGLVENLFVELTRAANYVCDAVRENLDPNFRLEDGALYVFSGPDMTFRYRRIRVEYRPEERVDMPYPGLEDFRRVAETRDFCFTWD
jgi:hypothetical protein